ncbi:sialidase family protein [Methylicorpusculum sp.]|uniref:sialidase family protein n=1 Tax=Methylicorpusculum sp. TaxID=2713644 RepID=UPI002ABC4672|nr:sialidase family protein [Methylicorpusculum sp.]MDZ4151004.1 sialidase family protein [Methylicorpusculum sp.]
MSKATSLDFTNRCAASGRRNRLAHGCSLLLATILFSACQSTTTMMMVEKQAPQPLHNTVAVSFDQNGTLWRVVTSKTTVWVDNSTDNGKSFGPAVKVNPELQKIHATPEDPPQIVVGRSGTIYLLYSADDQQKASTFFTISTDQGRSFSRPIVVSDHAKHARNYMDALLLDRDENLYVFWHDQRHESPNGSLSLYYTTTNTPVNGQLANQAISGDICSCCRTTVALAPDNQPVVLARMVFAEHIRDHALFKKVTVATWSAPQRVSWDSRALDACPEQGPALAVDERGRSHMVWFSLGQDRQGILYAHTDDYGKTLSPSQSLGNSEHLAAHPDVLVVKELVVMVWQEFDGTYHRVFGIVSTDRGERWSAPAELAKTPSESGQPKLISNGYQFFLSWVTGQTHEMIEIKQ